MYNGSMEKRDIDKLTTSRRNLNWANMNYYGGEAIVSYDVDNNKGVITFSTEVESRWYENNCRLTIIDDQVVKSACDCLYHDEDDVCGHVLVSGYYYVDFIQNTNEVFGKSREEVLNERALRQQEYEKMLLQRARMAEISDNTKFFNTLNKQTKEDFGIVIQQGRYRIDLTIGKEDLSFNYFGKNKAYLTIRARIGDERLYVVRSFTRFFEYLDNQARVEYGKFLTLTHDKRVFDKPSQAILDDLRDLNKYNYENDRRIVLSMHLLSTVYAMLSKLPKEYHNVELKSEALSLDVEVKMLEDNIFELKFEVDSDYYFSNNAFYQFKVSGKYRNKFELIKYTIDNFVVKETLARMLNNENKIHVDFNTLAMLLRNFKAEPTINLINAPHIIIKGVEAQKLYLDVFDDDLHIKYEVETSDGDVINGLDESFHFDLPDSVSDIYRKLSVLDYEIIDDTMVVSLSKPDTFQFLAYGLPHLQNDCEIFASESLKYINRPTNLNIKVGVQINNGLLEVDIDSLNISKEELADVLRKYRRKRKFYRLKNGEILNLESQDLKELDEVVKTFELNNQTLAQNSKVPLYRAFQVEGSESSYSHLQVDVNENLTAFVNQFKDISLDKIKIVSRFNGILKPYQVHGVKWLTLLAKTGLNGILADDMGLGKTIQVIAYLEGQKRKRPSIVVCPASLMFNWEAEFEKFDSPLKHMCIYGVKDKRRKLIENINEYDVVITTYDYLRSDVKLYENVEFESMIIDEAQYIKNPATKAAKAVKQIKAEHRFALSGTPIENRLSELWSIFDYLMPGYLYSYNYFRGNYETPITIDQDVKAINKLKTLVQPFILRRTKQEVLDDLPDKLEKTLSFSFNEAEEQVYLAKLAQGSQQVSEILGDSNPDKLEILKILGELRQICCDPRLIYENFDKPSTKMDGCIEVVDSIINRQEKVLIFSSFTSILDLIETELRYKNIKYYKLTGRTSKEERRRLVAAFQKDRTGVFLMSLKAAGVGLNLTAAQNVIHFDPWWNVSAENQATDRTHRIGQTKDVQVFKLIMKDSIEEKILKMQENKKELSDMFIEGSKGSFASMSKDEIMNLFK